MLHIMGDLNESRPSATSARRCSISRRLREGCSPLARQTERLEILGAPSCTSSRLHRSNLPWRTAEGHDHIMGDLREPRPRCSSANRVARQAGAARPGGKLARSASSHRRRHELNNPLNNTGLFVATRSTSLSSACRTRGRRRELRHALQQVGKATEIISHLAHVRTGAPVSASRSP